MLRKRMVALNYILRSPFLLRNFQLNFPSKWSNFVQIFCGILINCIYKKHQQPMAKKYFGGTRKILIVRGQSQLISTLLLEDV